MTKKILLIATLLFSGVLTAQKATDIVGIWWNEEKDGRVEVYQKGDKFYGKVEYVKKNVNPDGSKPKRDLKNPDPAKRKRVIQGCVILKGLKWTGDEWEGGEIYDTKSGSTYSCFARMNPNGTLYFKGYIGFSLIGRSTTWTRYK